jgi:homoserine O-succinyltransferase/O-acetyltransferase
MSIVLPVGLPARQVLLNEGIEVLSADELRRGVRRPLRICLVNLMPNKVATETQIARLLGATSIPVELSLCVPDSYRPRNAPADHLAAFYRPWTHIRDDFFDGVVVSGAPVETLPFEDVAYWADLCRIFDWARSLSIPGFYICWAAQAALYHFHKVPKHRLPEKMFGVFRHRRTNVDSQLLQGFSEEFPVPVSRHTEVRIADLPAQADLKLLAVSPEAGVCLIEDRSNRAVYMFNHLEYDVTTLADEFRRDRQAGKQVDVPCNYFPDDDPQRSPANIWRPYGELLFANWLSDMQTARARVNDESLIQRAITAPRSLCTHVDDTNVGDHADLLIAVADSTTLPSALCALGKAGAAPLERGR